MLDIAYVRENLDEVRERLQTRGFDVSVLDRFADLDRRRRAAITEAGELSARRNRCAAPTESGRNSSRLCSARTSVRSGSLPRVGTRSSPRPTSSRIRGATSSRPNSICSS